MDGFNNATIEGEIIIGSESSMPTTAPGDFTVSRSIMTNSPADKSSQMPAGELSFTAWDGLSEEGLGANPWHETGLAKPRVGNLASAFAYYDGRETLLFRGWMDSIKGGIDQPSMSCSAIDPIDTMEAPFEHRALFDGPFQTLFEDYFEGEHVHLLGNWDPALFARFQSNGTDLGIRPNFVATYRPNLEKPALSYSTDLLGCVPVLRALRRAGFGTFPSIKPGHTVASVPFEMNTYLEPEMGAYIKAVDKTNKKIVYGLSFNGWDSIGKQDYEIFFRIAPKTTFTFQSDDGQFVLQATVTQGTSAATAKLTNIVSGASKSITGIPKSDTGFYDLSLFIQRTSGATKFTLAARVDNSIWAEDSTKVSAAVPVASITGPPARDGVTYQPTTPRQPPFRVKSTTNLAESGFFEVRIDSSSTSNWGFGGFIINWETGVEYGTGLVSTYQPNLVFNPKTAATDKAKAVPRFEGKTVKDVFLEWAKATCSPWWFDENGRLRVEDYTFLYDKSKNPSTHYVKTSAAWYAGALKWEEQLEQVKKEVVVSYARPIIRTTDLEAIFTVAQEENRIRMEPNQVLVFTYMPPDKEDWVGLNLSSSRGYFPTSRRRWPGGQSISTTIDARKISGDDIIKDSSGRPSKAELEVTFWRKGMGGVQIRIKNKSTSPITLSGFDELREKQPDGSTKITPDAIEYITPILNALTVITWDTTARPLTAAEQTALDAFDLPMDTDFGNIDPGDFGGGWLGGFNEVEGVTSGDPAGVAEGFVAPKAEGTLTHEAGWTFGTLPQERKQAFFSYLKEVTGKPVATATEVRIYPDPELKLGDTVSLELEDGGATLIEGTVTSKRDVVGLGKWEQYIKITPFIK